MTTLDFARRYIRCGWHVMPVFGAPDGVCNCGAREKCKSPGKHPALEHGQHDASTDPATVERWFTGGGRNIGLHCAPSGIIALDVDGPRPKNGDTDGRADLARLIEEHGPLPDTIEARTGSGAEHRLFRDPGPGVETVGKLGRAIDVQRKKLIVVAPSVHFSGGAYSWRDGRAPWEFPLAELPPAWIELLRAPDPTEREERPASRGQATGEDFYAALESLDQRYVLQCLSGSALVNGERFAFKAKRTGKYNLQVDRGDGWEGTSNYIDSSGRIAARSTGNDDGGPLASTWLRYYKHDDKAIRRGLIELVPELAKFGEPKPPQRSPSEPIPSAEHPHAPHVNGHAAPIDEIQERLCRERPAEPDPSPGEPPNIGDPPADDDDVEPADDENTAEVPPDEHPNNPAGEPFARGKNGQIPHTSRNIKLAIRKLGVGLRYDEFADQELISGLPKFGPFLDDAAVNRLRVLIHERFNLLPKKEWFYDVISDCAQDGRFHPVRDYLAKLRWDGKPRLDGWLTRYGCAEDNDYTQAVGSIVLIAAVRRVRQPGCKFDEMLILESPTQGKFKSSALRVLAVRDDWFSDDLPLKGDTKQAMETTAGKWIVEAGELKGMSRGDVNALKSYLSRQIDEARMSYGRKRKRQPRQFVPIGTTNQTADYFKDDSGNRRFWPVRVVQFAIDLLRTDRDQLWAEAAHREALGESIRMDPKLYGAAAVEQESRRQEDSIEIICDRHFGSITGKIETEDAWRVLGIANRPLQQDEVSRFGAAMRKLGWDRDRRRAAGERGYFYLRGDKDEREVPLAVFGHGRGIRVTTRTEADRIAAEQEASLIGAEPDSSPRPPGPPVQATHWSTPPAFPTRTDAPPVYFSQFREGQGGQ